MSQDSSPKNKLLLNLCMELSPAMESYFEKWGFECLKDPSATTERRLDAILIDGENEDLEELNRTYSLLENGIGLISVGPVSNFEKFLRFNGKIILGRDLTGENLILNLLGRIYQSSFPLHLDDLISENSQKIKQIHLANPLRSGFYSDLVASEAHAHDFDPIRIKSSLINLMGYLCYLRDANITRWPIEIEYGISGDEFLVALIVGVEGFSLEHLWEGFAPASPDIPGRYLLTNTLNSSHYFDIFYIEKSKKIFITLQWKRTLNNHMAYPILSVGNLESHFERTRKAEAIANNPSLAIEESKHILAADLIEKGLPEKLSFVLSTSANVNPAKGVSQKTMLLGLEARKLLKDNNVDIQNIGSPEELKSLLTNLSPEIDLNSYDSSDIGLVFDLLGDDSAMEEIQEMVNSVESSEVISTTFNPQSLAQSIAEKISGKQKPPFLNPIEEEETEVLDDEYVISGVTQYIDEENNLVRESVKNKLRKKIAEGSEGASLEELMDDEFIEEALVDIGVDPDQISQEKLRQIKKKILEKAKLHDGELEEEDFFEKVIRGVTEEIKNDKEISEVLRKSSKVQKKILDSLAPDHQAILAENLDQIPLGNETTPEELDEEIKKISKNLAPQTKKILKSKKDSLKDEDGLIESSEEDQSLENQLVSGQKEDDLEGHQLVKGKKDKGGSDAQRVKGQNEDEGSENQIVKGQKDKVQVDNQLVKGQKNEIQDATQKLKGDREEQGNEIQKISADFDSGDEKSPLQKDSPKASLDDYVKIKGSESNKEELEIQKILGETLKQAQEEKWTIKDTEEKIKEKLKTIIKGDPKKLDDVVKAVVGEAKEKIIEEKLQNKINPALTENKSELEKQIFLKNLKEKEEKIKELSKKIEALNLALSKASEIKKVLDKIKDPNEEKTIIKGESSTTQEENRFIEGKDLYSDDFEKKLAKNQSNLTFGKQLIESLGEGKNITEFEIENLKRLAHEGLESNQTAQVAILELKRLKQSSDGKVAILVKEIEGAKTAIKARDLMLIKAKDGFAQAMAKKDNEISTIRERTQHMLNKMNNSKGAQFEVNEFQKLREERSKNLVVIDELKNKLSQLAKKATQTNQEGEISKEGVPAAQIKLQNELERAKQDKISGLQKLALVTQEKIALEKRVKAMEFQIKQGSGVKPTEQNLLSVRAVDEGSPADTQSGITGVQQTSEGQVSGLDPLNKQRLINLQTENESLKEMLKKLQTKMSEEKLKNYAQHANTQNQHTDGGPGKDGHQPSALEIEVYKKKISELEHEISLVRQKESAKLDANQAQVERERATQAKDQERALLALQEKQDAVSKLKEAEGKIAEKEGEIKTLDHKLKLAQKQIENLDRAMKQKSKTAGAVGGDAMDAKTKHLMKQVEMQRDKAQADFQKVNTDFTELKKNSAAMKAENTGLKNKLQALERELSKFKKAG